MKVKFIFSITFLVYIPDIQFRIRCGKNAKNVESAKFFKYGKVNLYKENLSFQKFQENLNVL